MKYTTQAALEEMLRRAAVVRKRRERRQMTLLSTGSVGLLAGLVLIICMQMPGRISEASKGSLGSFLLDAEAGGYVLAALIAFILGVSTVLLCSRGRKKQAVKEKQSKTPEGHTPEPKQNGGEENGN